MTVCNNLTNKLVSIMCKVLIHKQEMEENTGQIYKG